MTEEKPMKLEREKVQRKRFDENPKKKKDEIEYVTRGNEINQIDGNE